MATMAQLLAETFRLGLMRGLEDLLRGGGYGRIAGVDEAGRGSLAGPVVAAAVVVEPDRAVPGVDDSKALSAAQRSRLADAIRRAHPVSAVAAVSPREIDRINILEATRRAMRRCLCSLRPAPDLALIDAVALSRDFAFPSLSVIRGDQISYAVACASILAKHERDQIMIELDGRYPHYGFADHKGYGAARHRQALREYGPCPVHRLTFRSVLPAAGATRADRVRPAGVRPPAAAARVGGR
jgi:ribonuclease HII